MKNFLLSLVALSFFVMSQPGKISAQEDELKIVDEFTIDFTYKTKSCSVAVTLYEKAAPVYERSGRGCGLARMPIEMVTKENGEKLLNIGYVYDKDWCLGVDENPSFRKTYCGVPYSGYTTDGPKLKVKHVDRLTFKVNLSNYKISEVYKDGKKVSNIDDEDDVEIMITRLD